MNTQVSVNKLLVVVNLEHDLQTSIVKAKLLAKELNAEIHLLVAIHDSVSKYSMFLSEGLYDSIKDEIIIKAEKALDRICDQLHHEGFTVLPHVRWCQSLASAISHLTMILQPQYVIKNVSNDQDFCNPLSTAQDRYCIKLSRCGLLLTRHDKLDYQHVAVALDVVATDPQHIALNHQLITEAKQLADRTGAKVSVINVYEVPFNTIGKYIDGNLITHLHDNIAQYHEKKMREYIEAHDLPEDSYHIHKGDPGQTVAAYATTQHVDLFVMGTAIKDNFTSVFLSDIAEDLLLRINSEILCIPLVREDLLTHIDELIDFENYDDFREDYH